MSFLWKIDSAASPGSSYLFGTMHVRDLRAFGQLEKVFEKIDACQAFAVEFKLDQMAGHDMAFHTQLPGRQSLRELIPPKKYIKLRRIISKSTGVDIDLFRHTLPFMIVGLVSGMMMQKDMPESLDEHLWNYARSADKDMHGIETFEEQLQIMSLIPLDVQLKMLLDLGRNISRFRRNLHRVTELYQEGKLQQLSKSVTRNAHDLRKLLLYRRNEIMASRITGLAKEKTIFAAIGAGHLGGEKGVIRLIKQKGFTCRPA